MKLKKTKYQLSKISKKQRIRQIKLFLATLKVVMDGCDTYDQFKFYVNHAFKESADNDK